MTDNVAFPADYIDLGPADEPSAAPTSAAAVPSDYVDLGPADDFLPQPAKPPMPTPRPPEFGRQVPAPADDAAPSPAPSAAAPSTNSPPVADADRPSMLSTMLQAAGKGISEAATDSSRVLDPFTDRPQAQTPPDAVDGYLKQSLLDGGWRDPNVWAAKIAHGLAASSPTVLGSVLGAFGGGALGGANPSGPIGAGTGALIGGIGGGAIGSAIQTVAPAYLEGRASGLDHDAAVSYAIKKTGIDAAFAGAMSAVPFIGKGGDAALQQLKPTLSRVLGELFVAQPSLMAGQKVADNALAGKPLGEGVADSALEGAVVGGAMHAGHALARTNPIELLAGQDPNKAAVADFLQQEAQRRTAEAAGPEGPQSYDYTTKDGKTHTATPTDPEVQQGLREAEIRRQEQEAKRGPEREAEDAALQEAAAAKAAAEQAAAQAAGQQPPPDAPAAPAEPPPPAPGGAGTAAQPPRNDAHDILRGAGYSDDDIAKMSPEEQASEVEDAQHNGVQPVPPNPAAGTRAAPVKAETAADVDAAAAHVNPTPTPAQIDAGNYQKGHVVVDGLPISIETPAGSVRSGTDSNGTPWQTTMPAHYGYIKGSEGADGDHVDVYVGPNPNNGKAFVVDQVHPHDRSFDEHKVILGVDDAAQAAHLYAGGFSDGSGWGRIGSVTETTPQAIKSWIAGGKVGKPMAPAPKLPAGFQDLGPVIPGTPLDAGAAPSSAPEGRIDGTPLESAGQAAGSSIADASQTPLPSTKPGSTKSKTRPAPAPQPLIRFLRNAGGVKDQRGELKALDLYRHPGLVNNKSGMSLDHARRAAAEAGYLGGDTDHAMANTSVADFLDALAAHPRYSVHDEEAVAEHKARKAARFDDVDRKTNDHTRDIRATLADHDVPDELIDPVAVSLAAELMHSEGLAPLPAYEEAAWRLMLAERDSKAAIQSANPEIPFDAVLPATPAHLVPDEPWNDQPGAAGAIAQDRADGGDRTQHPGADAARAHGDRPAEEGAGHPEHQTDARPVANSESAGSESEVGPAIGAKPGDVYGDSRFTPAARELFNSKAFKTALKRHDDNPANRRFIKPHPESGEAHMILRGYQDAKNGLPYDDTYSRGGGYDTGYTFGSTGELTFAAKDGASAPAEQKPKDKWTKIGENHRGHPVYEDENGVRSYVESGVRVSESVGVRPGGGIEVSKEHGRDYTPVEKTPAEEAGAEGKPQLVIPGAEKIGQGEQAQRGADKPLQPKVPQKDAGGLFGDESKQTDLLDLAKKPAEPAKRDDRAIATDASATASERSNARARLTDRYRTEVEAQNDATIAEMESKGEPVSEATRKFLDARLDRTVREVVALPGGHYLDQLTGKDRSTDLIRLVYPDGKVIEATVDGRASHLRVKFVGEYGKEGSVGTSVMRQFLRGLQQLYPNATEVGGRRISGAREDNDKYVTIPFGPKTAGEAPEAPEPTRSAHVVAYRDGTPKESIPAEKLANRLLQGPMTLKDAAALLGEKLDKKTLEETVESGVVLAARQIAEDYGADKAGAYARIVQLYDDQPKLGTRTSVSIRDQAYSTPAPLAYVAATLADITDKTRVYEPTAGNGMLLLTANPMRTVANELNPERAKAIGQTLGVWTMPHDAADPVTTRRAMGKSFPGKGGHEQNSREVPFDRVIANPPFGPVRGEGGQNRTFDMGKYGPGYTTNEIDHAIAFNALDGMKDDGKAVLILGGPSPLAKTPEERAKAYTGKAKRNFYAALYGAYNVVDHFTVSGDLYEKQGAGWPVDVIVIDGRGRSALPLPRNAVPPMLATWDEVGGKLNGRGYSSTAGEPAGAVAPSPAGGRATGTDGGNLPLPERGTGGRLDQPGPVAEPANLRDGSGGIQRPTGPDAVERPAGDDREGAVRSGAARDADVSRPVKRAPIQQDAETETQVAYKPVSRNGRSLGTLVPANQRSAVANALNRLDKEVGGVDNFVAAKTGIPLDSLGDAFSAEQVDAIGLAIKNIEKGASLIVGDQTGVGKGRVVAGLIMYALKQGVTPVFVTKSPSLYPDIYRDLTDIKAATHLGREPTMMMTNNDEKVPLDDEGDKRLIPEPQHNALLAAIARGDKPLTHDIVLTTYNQMQTVKGAEGVRRDFLRAIAPNSLMLFDEAHEAGSLTVKRVKKDAPPPAADRAEFTRELVQLARAVYYSSATYAKRPDSMDFYSRTDMRLAVDDLKLLGETIAKGGVPLQTVNSSMLAEAGQYLRRERTFEGIKYGVDLVPTDRQAYRDFATALRGIQSFSELVKESAKELDIGGTDIIGHDGATGEAGAQSINFTSVMHNVVGQYLLAVKADEAANRAVAAIRAGQRPVIALANTNESFLSDFMEQTGAKIGDKVDLDFRGLLDRYLERSREVLIKEGFAGKGRRHRLTDAELGPLGVAYFKSVRKMIEAGSFAGLPVSPMDRMRQLIKEAGYTVGEITGRSKIVDYGPKGAVLASRPSAETSIAGRRAAIRDFNSGKLAALIINAAGSTGLSLHDDPRFPESGWGQRHMIIAQANGDINTHMQTLGRINRTGQQSKPEFTQLGAQLAAEIRPMAILAKKMASLNANTTSAKNSALTAKDVPDFMNPYGDAVAAQVLHDEPDVDRILGRLAGNDPSKAKEDLMRKVTGRIALLDPDDQDRVMDLLQDGYQRLIAHKDAIGENALEAKTLDLDAKLIAQQELVPSKGDSPFEQAANLGTYDIKSQAKPMSFDAVLAKVAEATTEDGLPDDPVQRAALLAKIGEKVMQQRLAAQTTAYGAYRQEVLAPLEAKTKDAKAEDGDLEAARNRLRAEQVRLDGIREALTDLAGLLAPGAKVTLTDPETDEKFTGVVLDTLRTGKTKNPMALSSWTTQIAVPGHGIMNVPLSQLSPTAQDGRMKVEPVPTWIQSDQQTKELFDASMGERREQRLIATGNLLAGFAKLKGKRTIVHFTMADGRTVPGIMLGATVKASDVMAGQAKPLPTAAAVVEHVTQAEGTAVTSTDGIIRVVYQRPARQRWQSPEISIQIKAKKADGGRYFLDPGVMRVATFRKEGAMMVRNYDAYKAQETISALMKAGAKFERPLTEAEQAAPATAQPASDAKLSSFGGADDKPALYRDVESVLRLMGGAHFKGATVSPTPPAWVMNSNEAVRRSGGDGSHLPYGAFNPNTGEIWIRQGSGAEVLAAVHEITHALDEAGTLRATERRLLDAETPRLRAMVARRFGATAEQMDGMSNDEVQTYAAQIAYQDKNALQGQHIGVRRILERVANTLDRIKNAVQGRGYQTLDDLFNRIHSGELGQRPAGLRRPAQERIEPKMAMFGQTTGSGPFDGAYQDKPLFPRIREKVAKSGDNFVENWVDMHHPVTKLQNEVANRLGQTTLPDHLNPYLAKRTMPGKLLNANYYVNQTFVRPIVELARHAGLSMQDLGLYALAKHAPERNALMDQRDPSNNGHGSSITNDMARELENQLRKDGKWGALENIGKLAGDLREFNLRLMVSSGLVSKATADELRAQFQHYYPLSGWEDESLAPDANFFGEAKKLGPTGKEFHHAFGRQLMSLPEHPLVSLIHQTYRTVERAERNKAGKVVYRLMKQLSPDDLKDLARIDQGEMVKALDKATGLMVWREKNPRQSDPATLTVKLGGIPHYVEFKDKRTGEAVNRITAAASFEPVRTILSLYTHIKAAWTHLSFDFLAGHFLFRYPMELFGNQAEHGFTNAAKMAAQSYPIAGKVSRAVFKAIRMSPADRAALDKRVAAGTASDADKWAHTYFEAKQAGALMNFTAYADLDKLKGSIADDLARFKNDPVRAARGQMRHFFEGWDVMTSALDAAQRVAVYRFLREQKGQTSAQAALGAREATVDFNLRGKMAPALGFFRAFGNVAVQGAARFIRAVNRNKKQMAKVFAAFMLYGSTETLWNYEMGGTDSAGVPYFEKLDPHTRERGAILLMPGVRDGAGRPYPLKGPNAYVFNIPIQVGRAITQLALKAGGVAKESIGDIAGAVFRASLEGMTPAGSERGALAFFMPEFTLPAVHVATNTDWHGGPVHKPFEHDGQANAYQGYRGTSGVWKGAAKGINWMTGGDEHHHGAIDFYPESLREMLGFVTSAWTRTAGRVGDAASDVADGKMPKASDVPILSTFAGGYQMYDRKTQADYYDGRKAAYWAHAAMTKAKKSGDFNSATDIAKKDATELAAYQTYKNTDKQLKALYAQRDALDKQTGLSRAQQNAQQDTIEKAIFDTMEQATRRTKPQ